MAGLAGIAGAISYWAANARLRQVVEAKDTEIAALRFAHQAQLDVLRGQVEALAAEVAGLRSRAGQNSRNSSRPAKGEPTERDAIEARLQRRFGLFAVRSRMLAGYGPAGSRARAVTLIVSTACSLNALGAAADEQAAVGNELAFLASFWRVLSTSGAGRATCQVKG